MKLLRLVTADFDPKPSWGGMTLAMGAVNVTTRPVNRTNAEPGAAQSPDPLLVIAEIVLPIFPTIDTDGLIEIPDDSRRACEHAIETAVNLWAVFGRCRRRLASPWPPVALVAETEEERQKLAHARAFRYRSHTYPDATPMVEKPESALLSGLTDRLEGVQAMATFIGQTEPLARYREAIRFFEIAFALPVSQVEKKLAQFLGSGKFGYTRNEVGAWLGHRDGSMHGDGLHTRTLVWDADVARFASRIEQAMYDVLFNKADWHSPSKQRRDVWRATAGTTNAGAGVFTTQGKGATLRMQLFDGFHAYPHDLSASLNQLGPDWWCKFSDEPLAADELRLEAAPSSDASTARVEAADPAS